MDKMPIAEILQMYRARKFLCDTCSKELDKIDFSIEDHIAHMINPIILWKMGSCSTVSIVSYLTLEMEE
jgi:hypothetical protein